MTPESSAPSGRRSLPLPLGPLLGFGLAVIAVILVALVSNSTLEARTAAATAVSHSLEVLREADDTLSALKDAETGQRGYLLTGEDRYLATYYQGRDGANRAIEQLARSLAPDTEDHPIVEDMRATSRVKLAELARTIELRKAGKVQESMQIVLTDEGKVAMDRMRELTSQLAERVRARLSERQRALETAQNFSVTFTWGGSAILLVLIAFAAVMASRDFRARERLAWVRAGQAGLASRIQGEHRLESLGQEVVDYLCGYLGARVGAIYLVEDDGRLRRFGAHALAPGSGNGEILPGEGLAGQVARENAIRVVTDVPEGYLPVTSGVGRAGPRGLLIAPAAVDGIVQGVVELGFFRAVASEDTEVVSRVAETLAVAVRSSRERARREELLEETQRQAEELQAQQEELRVSNEELEEQGRALRESQARLENQQAELEQTNVQLEEQTQRLERQKRELLHTQEELSRGAEALERSSRYKSEFLANMSHELRTPLNSSLILAKLLADNGRGNLDEEQVRYARTIHASNNDLLVLINDILDLSKVEAGQVEVDAEPVDLDEVLAGLRATLEPVAAHKSVALHIERASGCPEKIVTDKQRLQQILRNLLSNALKFTERGEVALRVSAARPGHVAFAVRDTGIGIPPEQQDVIFEAFRQADGTTSRKYGGTGLGLSISRELARLLGGAIRLDSKAGEGSTFTLELPVSYTPAARREASPAPLSAAAQAKAAPTTSAPKPAAAPMPAAGNVPGPHIDDDRAKRNRPERLVLVVEDDPRFAQVLYELAHELDFDCVHCSTAGEALELARRLKPSGILLDVNLPDESGLAFLERIKRDPTVRHIPVHMLSVEDHTQTAMGMGAVGYALKPVAREELVKAMQRLEARLQKRASKVLVVEDDETMRRNIGLLLQGDAVEIDAVGTVREALERLAAQAYDCLITDLQLPDASGYELLEKLAADERQSMLPVIVYTGRALTREEETRLQRFSKSIIIKGARSPERLLDEVTLFLHRVEANLSEDKRDILRRVRQRDELLEGRRILLAEDDVRNIFALTRVLEPLGAQVEIARNGQEAVERSRKGDIDLVLMDIMMPVKDGLTAIREIRGRPGGERLPIIAITAKAMPEDRRQCLEAGANDYIAKPIDIDKLVSLCRVWMPK